MRRVVSLVDFDDPEVVKIIYLFCIMTIPLATNSDYCVDRFRVLCCDIRLILRRA